MSEATKLAMSELKAAFASPPDDCRIMMRWWWFGPTVTRAELSAELERMHAAGIGGVEVAFVYPMAVDDPSRGFRNDAFLSPAMLDGLGFASRRASELKMRFDVTIGSGWSFGGRAITPELAAKRLRFDQREIAPSETRFAAPAGFGRDALLGLYIGQGSTQEPPTTWEMLVVGADGQVAIPPGLGPRLIVSVFASLTGQVVKRAAVDADGYVLDHYKQAAIEAHLRSTGDVLLAACAPGSVTSVFCDSLEVYAANWTDDLLTQFQSRRGYDLLPLLPLIELAGEGSHRVRRDFGSTLTELYEERFMQPMRAWAARHGLLFRIQNYGQPPATVSSARYADLIEGEGWGWRTVTQSRWASSAGHLFRKPVISSETWTWVHSPSHRATPLDLKGEAHEHFLIGINQLIGHGWPYSPPEAGSPGWLFYASGALTEKNPWWPVMPELAAYLQRASFLLRQGEPVTAVAVYCPNSDAYGAFQPGEHKYLDLWHSVRSWIGPSIIPAILDAGHCFDLIDDGTLDEAGRARYRAIVLPRSSDIPDATRLWLKALATAGGVVVAVDCRLVGDWSWAVQVSEGALAATLSRHVPADLDVRSGADIGFVHRKLDDGDIYFVANTGNVAQSCALAFRDGRAGAEIWDPLTGTTRTLSLRDGEATIALESYGACFVVFRDGVAAVPVSPATSLRELRKLDAGWTVEISGATREVRLPHCWSEDSGFERYSGMAAYQITFALDAEIRGQGQRVVLDFGRAEPGTRALPHGGSLRGASFTALVVPPVREAATVFVNGRRAGSVWAPPYQVDITEHLRAGDNVLRVDVYNTAINAMTGGGHVAAMAVVKQAYGQRARSQDFDGLAPLPSGLNCVPRLLAAS